MKTTKTIKATNQFGKDLDLCTKKKYDIEKFKTVLTTLVNGEPLPRKYRNHKLSPKSENRWECHIAPDWLLIYMINSEEITLVRTGTHSDLF